MSLERNKYGVINYTEKVRKYTQEEVDEINEKIMAEEMKAVERIEADGYIKFPVFFDNKKTGELVKGFSYVHPEFIPSCSEGFYEKTGMKYNIYIPSYDRAGAAMTPDRMMLDFDMQNWYLAIDPSQYEKYIEVYPAKRIIIRDPSFRSTEKLDMATSVLSPITMHGTAGIYNFLLYFSRSMGESHYWTMDDDIKAMAMKAHKGDERANMKNGYDKNNFFRCSRLLPKYGFSMKKFLYSIEELGDKMRNPGFLGVEKFGLVFDLPLTWKTGTRLYSFYLTNNSIQCDHYGQHNNDVITSLELSKRGYINLLFEGICYDSLPTQKGGGLTEVYKSFGTLDKGKVLARTHPKVSKISNIYNRIHHVVNYHSYNKQRIVGAPISREDE